MSEHIEYTPNLDFIGKVFPAEVEYISEHEAWITTTLPDGFVVKATDSYRQNRRIKPEVIVLSWNPNLETYDLATSYLED